MASNFCITGASKQLAILLEGESLLNDGTAIVMFNVLVEVAQPGAVLNGKSSCVN